MCEHCREEKFKESLEELKDVKGFNKIYKSLGDKPYEDLSGKKFYRLTPVKAVGRNKQSRVLWLCECECSNKTIVVASDLKYGSVKSCGCLSKIAPTLKRENLEGKVFGRWTVIKDEGGKKVLCRCSCGTERWVDRGNLRGNVSQSCGCLQKEETSSRFIKDLRGMRFGRLVVQEEVGRDKHGKVLWKTLCDCGNTKVVSSGLLLKGHTRSCGCLKREQTIKRCTKPMIGKTFGRLKVVSLDHNENGHNYYKCLCLCGNTTIVDGNWLRSGNTKSCGCLAKERRKEFDDLSGQRFGKLVVMGRAPYKGKGHGTRFLCKCDCGGTAIVPRHSLLTHETMSCGCLNSKGEYKVAQILTENNINFEKQKIYKDLRTTKFGAPKFDFYIPEENYLIEYDGEQHFRHTNLGWNDEEHFKKVKERDELKNEYCKEKGIPLIRIPYMQYENLSIEDLKLETTKFRVV
jgi:hypothetical protein